MVKLIARNKGAGQYVVYASVFNMLRRSSILVLFFARGAAAQTSAVQVPSYYDPEPLPPVPAWATELSLMGANALIGGLSAGALNKVRGGTFQEGFARGFLGGAVVYAGKRVAAERFPGAGLTGRNVAAVGSSMVRNASEGAPVLSNAILPMGPVRLYLDRAGGPVVRVKADLNTLVLIAYAATVEHLDLDFGSSLSAGTPVFRATEHLFGSPEDTVRASGKVVETVVFLSDLPWRSPHEAREIFAHERIHVLQKDQVFIVGAEPISAWLVSELPRLAPLYRYVDLHGTDLLFSLMRAPFPRYENRPWELEAFHFTRR